MNCDSNSNLERNPNGTLKSVWEVDGILYESAAQAKGYATQIGYGVDAITRNHFELLDEDLTGRTRLVECLWHK